MESIWKKTAELPQFAKLEKDIKTDVLIIGGGIAGLLTAHFLTEKGAECIIVEKDRICNKTTANTTAKITLQHGLCYDKIFKSYGYDVTKAYYEANLSALKEYEKLSAKIHCDYGKKDNYVYSLNDRKVLESELKTLEKIGCDADFIEHLPLPLSTVGAVRVKNQAQFHPLKFISKIAENLEVYENTFVRKISENEAVTDNCKITFEKAVIATHFPFINNHGGYFIKLYQHRSYVIALENVPDVKGMYVDESDKGLSFRNHENLLILGGGSHRTGKKGGNWAELREFRRINYPQAKEVAFWATQDCMSLDSIPYIGEYFNNAQNLYVASGFNKWGMTGSMVSAMILSDIITDKENPYAFAFNPQRSILKPQLLVNGFESVVNLLTPTAKRCPHLGCALKWNKEEHSWDCPCHGSRFTENGKLLDNPANGDI
ncbi:MAG: FAD-dependent oxidoreductase [Clostridia bacterium]|nr:FAD-dependent oxidoreductase [Clostridia bacterium]